MQPSWRALFLIVVAAGVFHIAEWQFFLVVFGYLGFESLDQWLAKRAKSKAIDAAIEDELYGWETDPDDPEYEDKNELTRVRLTSEQRIVVGRIAELLRRTAR
jgi:hypothetical protein